MFAHCDLALVEGDLQADAPKIEVWRAERGTPPIAWEDPSILAVVTDDPLEHVPAVLPRSNAAGVAQWILDHMPRLPFSSSSTAAAASRAVCEHAQAKRALPRAARRTSSMPARRNA
jgi:hypothetical protein